MAKRAADSADDEVTPSPALIPAGRSAAYDHSRLRHLRKFCRCRLNVPVLRTIWLSSSSSFNFRFELLKSPASTSLLSAFAHPRR
jgi:hypothetical protein